ncbi:MAG: SDR family oxidoreductase [Candidatus Eremiobacterota bacterium]
MKRKVALVTGAGVRLGRAIAVRLARDGYDLVLHYHRSAEPALETARLAQAEGARTELASADLSLPGGAPDLAEKTCQVFDRLDLLVNNAAVFLPTPDLAGAAREWDRLMTVNLKSPFMLVVHLADRLRANRGAIVNLTDIYADRPLRFHLPYCVSKAGLAMLTRMLAVELAPDVRTNAVAPGAAMLPSEAPPEYEQKLLSRIPLNRLGTAEDVADAVAFLAGSPYLNGHILAVDGGRILT